MGTQGTNKAQGCTGLVQILQAAEGRARLIIISEEAALVAQSLQRACVLRIEWFFYFYHYLQIRGNFSNFHLFPCLARSIADFVYMENGSD